MSTPQAPGREHAPAAQVVDKAQYAMAAFLAVVGAYVCYDASTLSTVSGDYVPPAAMSYLIGGALIVLAAALAVATARGDVAEADDGEDVDLAGGADLQTLGLLVAVMVLNVALIDFLGWAITGAFLFAASAWVLGSRHWVRNIAVGVALSLGTFYGFYVGLGVPIPAGILDGYL